jgi:hypothetical protein
VIANHTAETSFVWQDGVRMTAFVLLALSSGLMLRFVLDHPRMPKTAAIPLASAVAAFSVEMLSHWHHPVIVLDGAPLAFLWSLSIIIVLWPYMGLKKKP